MFQTFKITKYRNIPETSGRLKLILIQDRSNSAELYIYTIYNINILRLFLSKGRPLKYQAESQNYFSCDRHLLGMVKIRKFLYKTISIVGMHRFVCWRSKFHSRNIFVSAICQIFLFQFWLSSYRSLFYFIECLKDQKEFTTKTEENAKILYFLPFFHHLQPGFIKESKFCQMIPSVRVVWLETGETWVCFVNIFLLSQQKFFRSPD